MDVNMDYLPITSFKSSKNRLLEIDWSSLAYHQWFSMTSKNRAIKFDIISSEDEIRVWKTLMISKLIKYVKLFNPKTMVISLEGDGVIWRKTLYKEYYANNTKIFHDKKSFYVKFDNFLYRIWKDNHGDIHEEKLDPFIDLSKLTEIQFSSLSDDAKNILSQRIPEYKGNRKKQQWNFLTEKKQWVKLRDSFAYEVAKCFRSRVVKVDETEGDDVLYVSTRHFSNKFDDIVLVTRDSDFLQLLDQDNLYIYNHEKDTLMDTIDAKKYLEIKILSGDDSDNINGCVLPGKKQQISVKKATELFESTGYMYKTSTVDGWDNQYIRNRNLIDMSCLPNDYYKKIQCALDKDDIVLDEWECVYSLNIPEKMINEINSMRNIGYYVMHDIAAVDSDIDLFKEHLVAKSETPVITEPIAYKFGVAGIFGQSY